ncbi:hypothetical protein K8R14_02590, partial [bacterium]|nr:hypothetical protein [bacterium]
MIRKTKSFFGLGWLILFLALVWAGNALAGWTPNDDGEMVWWEPPVAFESMRIAPLNVDTLQENQGEINAEIIFAMDTSGSMSDEFDVLCNRITKIIEGVANAGINIGSHIYGIRYNRNCTENTVYNVVVNNGATPTVDHSEDWGPAIVDLSKHYSWPSGHVRIVIPMSDESAQNGGWGYWDSADEQAANDAIAAAVDNSVLIIPVLCSGYNQGMLTAAQRMAQTTHGRYFTSTSPVNDLVDGIVNAIKDAIGSIEITGIYPVSYIEDAWQDPENLAVHKLPGDIVYLACSVNNSTDKNVTAKLTFSYPSNWQFVNDDVNEGVKKREGLSFPEEDVANVTAESGKAIISNISVPAKSGSKVGRTDTYLVKLVIPTNELAGTCPLLSYKVEWDNIDPSGQRFQTSEKFLGSLAISDNRTRFILTNRNLMYERYGDGIQDQSSDDNGRVNTILANLYSFAAKQNAYVFYIDRWDFYDDFSENNPDCGIVNNAGYCENSAPIALWDRENYYDCSDSGTGYECANYSTMNEADINAVANAVDDYIHYWADQTGGKSNNHWLLIIGDDKVVPFYRPNDPTSGDGWTKYASSAYDASDHTEEMAEEGWFFSESIYQDTNDSGWGDGDVDLMFVGRIVSNNSSNLNAIIENYLNDLKQSNSIDANSFTFSSGEPYYDCNRTGASAYREQILKARPYSVQAGY